MLRSAALAVLRPPLVVLVLLDTCVNCLSVTTMSSPLHTAILPCNFTLLPGDINLQELNVVWTRWTMPVAQYIGGKVTSGLRFSLREDRLKSGDASLHLSPVSMEDEGQYHCQVRYRTEKMDIEVNLTVRAPPQVHATIRLATHGSQGVVNCSATGFYPEGIKIAIQQDRETLKSESPSARRELDGTFSASSIYTFNWSTGDKELFICEVSHPALKQPIRRDARADSSILLLTNAVPGVKSVVICLSHRTQESVSKFIWRQGDTIVLIDNPNILMTPDGHMSVMSRYRFTPSGQEQVSCEVHYESGRSEKKIVQYIGNSLPMAAGVGGFLLLLLLVLLFTIIRQSSVSLSALIPVMVAKRETLSITCSLSGWCLGLVSIQWYLNGKKIEMQVLDDENDDEDEKVWVSISNVTDFSMKKGPTKKSCCQGETIITLQFTPENLELDANVIKCRALHKLTRRTVSSTYFCET